MIGKLVTRAANGCPYGGVARVEFQRADVVAFGKLRWYADFVVRYLVRLTDGREVMVNATEQVDDERWLRKQARILGHEGMCDRETGWVEKWRNLIEGSL